MLNRASSLHFATALLAAVLAADVRAEDAAIEAPAGFAQADTPTVFERCLTAVVDDDPAEGAWCDVRIDELNRLLSRSAAENQELAAAYHNRAVLALRRGDLEAARADLGAMLALAPANAAAYLTRGNLELEAGNFAAALEDFNEAVKLVDEAQLALALFNRALALRGLGDVTGALRDAEAAGRLSEAPTGAAAGPAFQADS